MLFINLFSINHTFTLKRNQILKGRKQIQKLFNYGKAINEFPLRVVFNFQESGRPLLTGFSVSKKKFRKAVSRNRVKRLMREAWRLNSAELNHFLKAGRRSLSVFIIYTGNDLPDFSSVQKKIRRIVDRLMEEAVNVTTGK